MDSHERARDMVTHLAEELRHGSKVWAPDHQPLTSARDIARTLGLSGRVLVETTLPLEAFHALADPLAPAPEAPEAGREPPISER
jgi:hypothetical protein